MQNDSAFIQSAKSLGQDQVFIMLENSLLRYHDDKTAKNKESVEFYIRLAHTSVVLENLDRNVEVALSATRTRTHQNY